MPNADRAAVAREVLTEALVAMKRAGYAEKELWELQRHMDDVAPAPPAPETVTVLTRRGVSVEWARNEQGSWHSNHGTWVTWVPLDHIASELFDRIAADAQVIAAKDKRIAELEREVEELRDDARTADDARGNLLLQTICRLPDVLTTGDWQEWIDEHRHQWLNDDRAFGGWVAERLSAHMTRVERERDGFEQMAREYSDNADYYRRLVVQIGETCGRDAYVSDDGSVQQDVLCAKVPELVIAMKHERDEARRVQGLAKVYHDDDAAWGMVLTQLYRALHPVADAATVKRVALRVKQYNGPTAVSAEGFARIILEELGYTIQEGA